MKKELIFYESQNGNVPVKDFLDSLIGKNDILLAKIFHKLDLLSLDLLWKNDVKFLCEKIYELRIKQSSNISRIFYFTFDRDSIVLLDGIIKKEQKLKPTIISRVLGFKNDYEKRYPKGK